MAYTARSVRITVTVLVVVSAALLVTTLVLALTGHGSLAIATGAACVVFGLVAFVVAHMTPAKSRPRRVLPPGRTVRFRNKRPFFTTAALALAVPFGVGAALAGSWLGPWAVVAFVCGVILGRVVFVFAVPPGSGRCNYEVTATKLAIRTPGEQRTVHWREVTHLVHRPSASTQDGGYTTTVPEYLELHLGGQLPQGRRGRATHRVDGPVLIQGVFRQSALSRLIIDQCREHLGRALRTRFDRDGELDHGDFRLTRDGVHAPNGFLSWRTDWQVQHSHHPAGITLTLFPPGEDGISGWVPEETIALDLLTALAARHVAGQ